VAGQTLGGINGIARQGNGKLPRGRRVPQERDATSRNLIFCPKSREVRSAENCPPNDPPSGVFFVLKVSFCAKLLLL